MGFQYLTNLPLDKAREEYISAITKSGFSSRTEKIPVQKAAGRVTASAVYAHICAPHYPASAMDGIAVFARDTFGAGETTPIKLDKSVFTVVDTGDPIPYGCDAVIMIEDVFFNNDGCAEIFAPAAPWQHIRQIGEDICAGEMILPSYTKISPAAIGAMLAGGVLELEVLAKPLVGIIPTGDEIIPPTSDPGPGDIIEFNSSIFSAILEEWDAIPKTFPIVPDDCDKIRECLEDALSVCDIVLLNAGSSAGREDYSTQAISEVGKVLCHGIAIKPGKPTILGLQGSKPILGVPGYPVSGIIVLEEFLHPIIEQWYHRVPAVQTISNAVLTRPVVSGLKYKEFIRVRMGHAADSLTATPLNRGSGVVTSFMKADGIVEIPQDVEGLESGSTVSVRMLRDPNTLSSALVAIGSHDPLLDELGDLLHRADPGMYINSTHVGSMGGIMAIRRGEAHIAGIHLLNEADGSYNTAFVKKYFPSGGVRLVECVGRTQGLMLQKGNPMNLRGIDYLRRSGVRYVNRQKGSGTRILADYLFKNANINTDDIYGYEREEYTHTSVAAQIANGTADVGMGIYSAAMMYDLDFYPICTEQYDLLIPESAWETPQIQRLIEIISGQDFRDRLTALGGYELDKPGRIRGCF